MRVLHRLAAVVAGLVSTALLGLAAVLFPTLATGKAWWVCPMLGLFSLAGYAIAVRWFRASRQAAPQADAGATMLKAVSATCSALSGAALVKPVLGFANSTLEWILAGVLFCAGVALSMLGARRAAARGPVAPPAWNHGPWGLVVGALMSIYLIPWLAFLLVEGLGGLTATLGINALIYGLATPLAIVLHELGHAGMASMVGLRVHAVRLGVGPSVFKGRWRGVRWQINSIPVLGVTLAAPRDTRNPKARFWLFIAGGPVASIAVALLCGALPLSAGDVVALLHEATMQVSPLRMVGLCSLILVAPNLLPVKLNTAMGELRTDGFHLLVLPFSGQAKVDELLAQASLMDVADAVERGAHREAMELAEQGARLFPGVFSMQYMLAYAHLTSGDLDVARARLTALRSQAAPRPFMMLLVLNALAYCDAALGAADLAAEALALSEEIMRKAPGVGAFAGTRGSVLARFGNAAEAAQFLNRSSALASNENERNETLVWLALADERMGQREAATRKLQDLRARVVLMPVAERLATELEGTCAQAPVAG